MFTEAAEGKSVSEIPHLILSNGQQNAITDTINLQILERFMVESFDSSKASEFRWFGVDFTHRIQDSILMISFKGIYYDAYAYDIEENLFFHLHDVTPVTEKSFPFCSFFILDGYYAFLNKYWLKECMIQYKEATECAEMKPCWDCYDVNVHF